MSATLRHVTVASKSYLKPKRPSLFGSKRPKVYLSNGEDDEGHLDDRNVLFVKELGDVDVDEGEWVCCFVKKSSPDLETPRGVINNIKAALTSPRAQKDEAGLYFVRKFRGNVEAAEFLGISCALFEGGEGDILEATTEHFQAWEFGTELGEAAKVRESVPVAKNELIVANLSQLLDEVNWGEGTATTVFGTTTLESFQGHAGLIPVAMKVTAENLAAVTSRASILVTGSVLETAVTQALQRFLLESPQVSSILVPFNMSDVLPHPISLSLDLQPVSATPSILSVRSPMVSHRGVGINQGESYRVRG